MQIRHNLVVGEKPFFRRGGCVLKTAYHLEKDENVRLFWMRRLRLGSALAGMALSVAACAALWPHAREAGATSFIVADTAAGTRSELKRVQLIAPTSTDERVRKIMKELETVAPDDPRRDFFAKAGV
jgi:hypothetical protein